MQHAVQALILHTGLPLCRHCAISEHLLLSTLSNSKTLSLVVRSGILPDKGMVSAIAVLHGQEDVPVINHK